MQSLVIKIQDLADLEHYGNLKEAHLRWLDGPSVKKALQILKRCTNLHRLTLGSTSAKWIKLFLPPSTKLCEFIMKLKHLTFLHIIYHDVSDCVNVQSRVDEVKAFVLLGRPNFKFYVSYCSTFHESRVRSEFDF